MIFIGWSAPFREIDSDRTIRPRYRAVPPNPALNFYAANADGSSGDLLKTYKAVNACSIVQKLSGECTVDVRLLTRQSEGYVDVDSRLERKCYMILGTWRNDDGVTFVFREDGTCDLNGEKLYFLVDNYVMETGVTPDALSNTHKVSSLDGDSLTLRDLRGSTIITYKMTRVTEDDTSDTQETAEPVESYTVTDE